MKYLKSFEECLDIELQEAYKQGLLSDSKNYLEKIKNSEDIESILLIIISVFAKLDSNVYSDMQRVADLIDLDKVGGKDLDNLGLIKGVPRPRSTHSLVMLTFAMDGLGEDMVLPSGLKVMSEDGQVYTTQNEVRFTKNKLNQRVDVLAVSQGTGIGERVNPNKLTIIHGTGLPYNIDVTNLSKSEGGIQAADDEEYRTYLKNHHKIHQKGNLWAYINYFRNYDGLTDYRIIPQWDGTGTIKVIIDCDEKLYDYHKQKIYYDLTNNEGPGLAGEDVTIQRSPAIEIGSSIHVVINTSSKNYPNIVKNKLRDLVKNFIKVYLNGGYIHDKFHEGLGIGDPFNPFHLAVFINDNLRGEDIESVDVVYPSKILKVNPYSKLRARKIEVVVD